MQVIQSLGEAISWFERELNWGVPATELRHLSGHIGKLYAALITNGQMATSVNQHGYDVVSADGERISVKTTLREVARKLNLPIVKGNGNNYNTRQLGSLVIKPIN